MQNRQTKTVGQGILGNSIKNILEIPLDQIKPNPFQPRIDFEENELLELARSIEENGLLEPILLNRVGDEEYIIIAGERRWRAHQILDKKMIQAIVHGHNLSQEKMYILSLVENIDRQNLHPIEVAIALKNGLMSKHFANQKEITQFLDMSKGTISKYISLCELKEDTIKEAITSGYKVLNVLSELSKIKDKNTQLGTLRDIISKKLSREDAIEHIKSINNQKVSPGKLNKEKLFIGIWGDITKVRETERITINTKKLNDKQKIAYQAFLETLKGD